MFNGTARLQALHGIEKRLLSWISIVAVAALAIGLAQSGVGHSLLNQVGIFAKPANYTSLTFTNPQSLPTRISSTPTRVHISFTLGNTSGGPRSYHWSMIFEHGNGNHDLAAGEVSLSPGENTVVARTVTASCASGQARITIQLAAPGESIFFWVVCSSGNGEKR